MAETGDGVGGRYIPAGYAVDPGYGGKMVPGGYMPYPPPAYGGTGYEVRRDYGSGNKRPVSAVAGRKTRGGGALLNNFNRATELSRTRPKHMLQDREQLYDEARILKHQMNRVKDENVKLHTKVTIL